MLSLLPEAAAVVILHQAGSVVVLVLVVYGYFQTLQFLLVLIILLLGLEAKNLRDLIGLLLLEQKDGMLVTQRFLLRITTMVEIPFFHPATMGEITLFLEKILLLLVLWQTEAEEAQDIATCTLVVHPAVAAEAERTRDHPMEDLQLWVGKFGQDLMEQVQVLLMECREVPEVRQIMVLVAAEVQTKSVMQMAVHRAVME
jgi:hypothetical protein